MGPLKTVNRLAQKTFCQRFLDVGLVKIANRLAQKAPCQCLIDVDSEMSSNPSVTLCGWICQKGRLRQVVCWVPLVLRSKILVILVS